MAMVGLAMAVFAAMGLGAPLDNLEVASTIVPAARHLRAAPYADWAHHHWVWLDHGGNGQADCLELAHDYISHNITIGAMDIDSTWEQGFNNFIPDTNKFPNMTDMIEQLHALDLRVIFWITSMVDTDSPNYADGEKHGYYLRNILNETGKMKWWHGTGSLVDYTNPDAVAWWHDQMDNMLDMNIDGWKCDGTDPYIVELIEPQGAQGPVTWHEYSHMYYGDFFNYTREKLGNDRLVMSRPVDAYGSFFVEFSPKYVMASGWVGDQDDTFDGLTQALKRYLQSAWRDYANFGSDIGGYRTPQKPRQSELFLRWAQLGAFSPLMENGGGGEHRPWMFDANGSTFVTDTYRNYVDTHYSLVSYLLSIGSAALENGTSVLHPMAPYDSLIDKIIDDFNPPTYAYLLGDRIFVNPINEAGDGQSTRVTFTLPNDSSWVSFVNASDRYSPGAQVTKNFSLAEFPVYQRAGYIVPRNAPRETSRITLSVAVDPSVRSDMFALRTSESAPHQGHGCEVTYTWKDDFTMELTVSQHQTLSFEWALTLADRPVAVTAHDGSAADFDYDELSHVVRVPVGVPTLAISQPRGRLKFSRRLEDLNNIEAMAAEPRASSWSAQEDDLADFESGASSAQQDEMLDDGRTRSAPAVTAAEAGADEPLPELQRGRSRPFLPSERSANSDAVPPSDFGDVNDEEDDETNTVIGGGSEAELELGSWPSLTREATLQLPQNEEVEAWQPTAFLDSRSTEEWLTAAPPQALAYRIVALEQALSRQRLKDASGYRTPRQPRASSIISFRDQASSTTRSLRSRKTEIPNEYLCSITYDIMVDPVVAADGFSYERESIARWFEEHTTSPMTGKELPSRILLPNHALRIVIRDFCEQKGVQLADLPVQQELSASDVQRHLASTVRPAFSSTGERSAFGPIGYAREDTSSINQFLLAQYQQQLQTESHLLGVPSQDSELGYNRLSAQAGARAPTSGRTGAADAERRTSTSVCRMM
ncbi:uncharacterized protein MONBRDRAFT_22946 [Monosiga brevicollis MX1]|uniref:U-box domain-containing protein n=1 Tax=Monosiga brevicollis TaxID=81824 RepID=A9USJ3_MONBE|nr:uncharacterized protein MONBRDRAFT_22946 [Monosiga brevicollis MX1]EDQ92110.1 predicted protein [Monosiga brevicollis MX1]|eukprot:XP_001743396.1 hypothetical protein [Monosiga brevicollis MX1]